MRPPWLPALLTAAVAIFSLGPTPLRDSQELIDATIKSRWQTALHAHCRIAITSCSIGMIATSFSIGSRSIGKTERLPSDVRGESSHFRNVRFPISARDDRVKNCTCIGKSHDRRMIDTAPRCGTRRAIASRFACDDCLTTLQQPLIAPL